MNYTCLDSNIFCKANWNACGGEVEGKENFRHTPCCETTDDGPGDCLLLFAICISLPLITCLSSMVISAASKHGETTAGTRSIAIDELFDGKICSISIFLPNYVGHHQREKPSSFYYYLSCQSIYFKFHATMQLVDIITDTLFAYDVYYNENRSIKCIGMISSASVIMASTALIISYYLDFNSWRHNFSKVERTRYRIRWSVLILTPLEDMVMLVCSVYLFATGNDTFYCYVCVVASACVIFSRLFNVEFLHNGMYGSRASKWEESSPEELEIARIITMDNLVSFDNSSDSVSEERNADSYRTAE